MSKNKPVQITILISLALLLLLSTAFAGGPYLEFLEFHQDQVNGITDFRPWSAAISPDLKHVYTASPDQDAINIFSRNTTSGRLTYLESILDFHPGNPTGIEGLNKTHALAISPDNQHVYVTGHDDNSLVVFSRDDSTGGLTVIERHEDDVAGVDGLEGAYWVTISPDGKSVYTTSEVEDAVSVFSRDAETGQLTFVEVHQDEMGGITSMREPRRITVSPDGKNVYVVSDSDFALVAFGRNTETGSLTLLQEIVRGVDEGNGLVRAESVVVSPDNRHLYTSSRNAVIVFHRDLDTGVLTLIREYNFTDDNLPNLLGGRAMDISSDGQGVFVGSDLQDALIFFQRDPYTGLLFHREERLDNTGGIDGLESVRTVLVSPDLKNVYVTGFDDAAIAVFGFTGELPEITVIFLPLTLK